MNKNPFWKIEGAYERPIESIYFNKNGKGLKGIDMSILFNEFSPRNSQKFETNAYL